MHVLPCLIGKNRTVRFGSEAAATIGLQPGINGRSIQTFI
jgi:hypothetical protein